MALASSMQPMLEALACSRCCGHADGGDFTADEKFADLQKKNPPEFDRPEMRVAMLRSLRWPYNSYSLINPLLARRRSCCVEDFLLKNRASPKPAVAPGLQRQ